MLATALLVLPALSAVAADNPWVGTWKLDLAKSKFTGDTFTYSKTPAGLYHFTDGSVVGYDFAIDGKDYPTAFGRSTAWTATADNAWTTVYSFNGKQIGTGKVAVSYDGKELTFNDTTTKPDGSESHDVSVYKRLTGGPTGLVGKWVSTSVNISAPNTYVVSSPSDGVIHWEISEYKETVEGKTDGSDLPITGPTVPQGLTLSIKVLGPKKLTYTVKISGKETGTSVQTVSGDGKTLTDVSWSPGKESEKSTAVYTKQ